MKGSSVLEEKNIFYYYEHEIDKEMEDQQDDPGKGHHSFCARHAYTCYLA